MTTTPYRTGGASARAVDAVYLSPHLDDAAFSCGGQIHARARRGERVLVVSVFAGAAPPAERLSPFAVSLHQHWRLAGRDVAVIRRAEDRAAVAILGAEFLHLDFADAIYRADQRGAPLYPDLAALFDRGRAEDDLLLTQVRDALAALPPAPFVAAPLGVGGHVDHCLLHRAAREAFPGDRLRLYEDYPYAESWRARRRAAARRRGWVTRVEALAEPDLEAKCGALAHYASQLDGGWNGDALERRVRHFCRRRGGERLWQAAGSAAEGAGSAR